MIATKIRDGDYKDINNVEEDLNRMCRNAQMFNEPGSQIYKVIVICIQNGQNYRYNTVCKCRKMYIISQLKLLGCKNYNEDS